MRYKRGNYAELPGINVHFRLGWCQWSMEKQPIEYELVRAKRLTSGDGNYFFGYYDIPAWNEDETFHLCHKVDFWNRMPKEDDIAEVGMIDVRNGQYIKLDETSAWNFQQGALLTWSPKAPNDEIIYNVRVGDKYKSAILNVRTSEKRLLDYPLANVDPTGRYGVSINFPRMFDFRPGYGYAGINDSFYMDNHSKDDGIYLVDLETGKGDLVISLDTLWEYTNGSLNEDKKLLVNHINFNTDGSRFVFLLRYFFKPGEDWGSAVITANADGSDLYTLYDYSVASHYYWANEKDLLIYANHYDGLQLYMWKDKTHKATLIDKEFFVRDGHCSFSPDKNYILYDSYHNKEGYRKLFLYDVNKKKGITLASYYSYPNLETDIRCDFHPRWNRSGNVITFDSIHEGQRHIYSMDLSKINI